MFYRGGIFRIFFVALVIIGLLSLGGVMGWSQGFNAGVIAGDGGAQSFAPRAYYGAGFSPFFFGFGLFFKLIFFLLIFSVLAKVFRFWAGHRGGPPGGSWGKPKHGHQGPPPWHKEQEGTSADQARWNPPDSDETIRQV